ncbi:MAG: 2-hydroxy-3-oxopropionate reductase [Christensenellales bacterium]|jgi:2-hydroxy-3-oxopropionate reductase
MKKIGFIGLGIMGKPMAKNLVKAGYDVVVADKFAPQAVEELVACGASAGASNMDVGSQADIVITMVPNSPDVKEALFGEDGAAKTMKKGTIVLDCSSINPIASREISAELEKLGIEMLDAPVSGGEPKAIDGTLAFMVGGKQEIFDQCKGLLGKMGSSVVRCGEIGAGNVTKLCNQIIVAVNIAALAEALQMGQMCGVEPEKIFEAIKGGLAGSTVMNAKAPMMMDQNFQPGFRIGLHIKDLNNVVDAASTVDAPIPLTQAILEMMKVLRHDGDENCDHSALLKYYQKLSDETLHR